MCGPLQFCVESANIIFVGTDKRFRRRLRHDTKEQMMTGSLRRKQAESKLEALTRDLIWVMPT